MINDFPTVYALCKARVIAARQVESAVEAYLANPEIDEHPIVGGYIINLKAAVRRHELVWKIARDPAASARLKRGSIWSAIMLARAQKA